MSAYELLNVLQFQLLLERRLRVDVLRSSERTTFESFSVRMGFFRSSVMFYVMPSVLDSRVDEGWRQQRCIVGCWDSGIPVLSARPNDGIHLLFYGPSWSYVSPIWPECTLSLFLILLLSYLFTLFLPPTLFFLSQSLTFSS